MSSAAKNNRPLFVVTAGPTREHLDPVRFLSNPSTGKMGFAVAEAAAARGCEVVLVAGPVALKTPRGVRRVDVVSAREMLSAAVAAVDSAPRSRPFAFVAVAAVADWRPRRCAAKKLKKREMSGTLELVRNPDVLKSVGARLRRAGRKDAVLVGFAAETGSPIAEAARKCREKRLAFTVANDVSEKGSGFGSDSNRVAFVRADGSSSRLPPMSKKAVARRIVGEIEKVFGKEARGKEKSV